MSDPSRRHSKGELSTVLMTSDVGMIAVAKSLLESSGIRYYAKGELLQNVFGLGWIPGVNPTFGSIELQVAPEDEASALEALRELLADRGEPAEEVDDDS